MRFVALTLALAAATMQAARGNWMEVAGLLGMAAGLICLLLSRRRPMLRWVAWPLFGLTAVSVIVVYLRMRQP